MVTQILVLIVLVLLSGLFSGAEIALVSLSPARLKVLVKSKRGAAKIVKKLKSNPQKLLITILIGNNVVNISASGLATLLFTGLFGSQGLGIATGVMTFFVLVFGEITPKTFAEANDERFALFMARPIYWMQIILTPIIWIFERITEMIFRIAGVKDEGKKVTEDELRALLSLTREEGEIDEQEEEYIENILDLEETMIGEIMTPRAKVVALKDSTSIEEALKFFHKNNYSRILVYHKKLDEVLGYFSVRSLLWQAEGKTLKDVEIQEAIKAPETMPAQKMLHRMINNKCHIAAIFDENGFLSGVATLEDILEEIVGDIQDETDNENLVIKNQGANTVIASGGIEVEEINKNLGTKLDDSEHKKISLLVLEHLGRFPKKDEVINLGEVRVVIQKIVGNRIDKVKVSKTKK